MDRLSQIKIEGFKSIRKAEVELGPINVLIGANGAGKSNFISLFNMLMNIPMGNVQPYISKVGGASSLLYLGPKITPEMLVELTFETEKGTITYQVRFSDAAPDTLIFAEENLYFQNSPSARKKTIYSSSSGSKEAFFIFERPIIKEKDESVKSLYNILLKKIDAYHFHDTSETSPIRRSGQVIDNRIFRHGNLAAYLYMLRETQFRSYKNIVDTIRLVAPHFHDFVLEPEPSKDNSEFIMLKWREVGSDYLFGPHQHSDGLLRFISLATLLLQPKEKLLDIIIIDEPELGLHPSAINVLGGLIRSASHFSQIIIATQSVRVVLNQFEAKDIVVFERNKTEESNEYATEIRRLKPRKLKTWLKDYTLGELWEKNVLGGRP